MTYKHVEGEVRLFYRRTRLVGSRPDGDSAWFLPDNPNLLSDIGDRSAVFNAGNFARVRITLSARRDDAQGLRLGTSFLRARRAVLTERGCISSPSPPSCPPRRRREGEIP